MKIKYMFMISWAIIVLILMFFWVTEGVFNYNLPDNWFKLMAFIDRNWALGGWHRLGVMWITLRLLADVMLIGWLWLNRHRIEWREDDKKGQGDNL